MMLEGSCHCGAVRFKVSSPHPYPFNVCYCRICRKTAGAGGSAINLSADNATLDHERSFFTGNAFFNQGWVRAPASTEARDGLGPLFNARWSSNRAVTSRVVSRS